MRVAGRLLLGCLVCSAISGLGWSAVAFGDGSSSAEGLGGSSSLGGSLVTPGSPTQGEQARAAEQAKLASPEAVAAREESQTKYVGLDPSQAAKLAGEAFPALINEPDGGPPKLPSGQSITGYLTDNAAQVDLGEGKHGVVESMEPLAIETSQGHREPLDLNLDEANGAFQPTRSGLAIQISKHIADGVQLASTGVSLRPVDANGAALGGSEGLVDGVTVLYANTQTDADTVVKPLALGFEEDTLLRSVDSPSRLSFQVGLPVGASLVSAKDGSGAEVVDEGAAIAAVPAPSARDAVGAVVPVSMSVAGSTLTLSVDEHAGEYQYPIAVDPTVIDHEIGDGEGYYWESRWENYTPYPSELKYSKGVGYNSFHSQNFTVRHWGDIYYETKGKSQIYAAWLKTSENNYSDFHATLRMQSAKEVEGSKVELPGEGSHESETWLCGVGSCNVPAKIEEGREANGLYFEQEAALTGSGGAGEPSDGLSAAKVYIDQEAGPSVVFNTTEEKTAYGRENPLYGNRWASSVVPDDWAMIAEAQDPGTGVYGNGWSSPSAPHWETESEDREGTDCFGVQCLPSMQAVYDLEPKSGGWGTESLPEGEDTVEVKAKDAVGLTAAATVKVKVDNTPPHIGALTGLPASHEIGVLPYHLRVEATDGSGTPSAGVASITASVDGRSLGAPSGGCAPGTCTATGEWTLDGENYPAGKHVLTLTATDNAGNVAKEEITFTSREPRPLPVGPGSVNPVSGALSLGATDVSVAAPGSGLSVSRSYVSRGPAPTVEGPLGSQWNLTLGEQESLSKSVTPAGMVLTAANGQQTLFASAGGGKYTSPTGDTSLVLSEKKVGTETDFLLSENGVVTTFAVPGGGSGSVWEPSISEGAGGTSAVTYSYKTTGGITEPTEELAPVPAGVSCSPTLNRGCRALKFVYATATTATGEGQSEWGEYNARLKEVTFTAYEPSSKAMQTKTVAEYNYDKQGRLRAEWNPQISPALKTVYGYDSEGHVTALTPPGQESWAFLYGTTVGDAGTGRLLKVTRAPASAGVWKGEAPKNTEAPKPSGTADVGVVMGVSNGVWSGEPVAYAYQWEDCNAKGEACTPILGATNANYKVASSDVGHTLVALVAGINGGGAVLAASAASSTVVALEETQYALPTGSGAFDITVGPDGNLWFTDVDTSKIGKITTSGTITEYELPKGSDPLGITAGPDSNLWFTEFATGKIGKITTSGTITEYELPKGSEPFGITAGPDGNLWFTEYGTSKIGKITTSSMITEYELPKGSDPQGITAGPGKEAALWFTDQGSNKIEKITTSGTITEYSLPNGSDPVGITVGPDSNLWFTDKNTSKIGKITTAGAITEYALPSGSNPWGITPGPAKESALWFTDQGNSKLGKITTSGSVAERSLPSSPSGIVAGPDGDLWFTSNNKVDKTTGVIGTEGEQRPAGAGATIEYHVPLSGEGLPTLTKEAVEKWGQTDVPTEATAIFPPDSPQGWPAKEYTRASIYYLDEKDRSVNVSTPTGGISTTEYNTNNDVVRTLSPDNRATALAGGEKSKELSKELDSESTYNETGSEPGVELLSTLGPKHAVELTNGTKAEAREHTVYSYNEGAPKEGGPYHLVTKMTEGAQIAGTEESASVRTTKTGYSAQSNLGWKLRKPTSVTAEAPGVTLTHRLSYEAKTGNLTETRMPAAGNLTEEADNLNFSFGKVGSENGQFKEPTDVAVTATGDEYVLDAGNHRVEEFNAAGGFVRAFGSETLSSPHGITIDSGGNVWVADTGHERLAEFTASGGLVKTYTMYSVLGIAAGTGGVVWVLEGYRIDKCKVSCEYGKVEGFSEPAGIAVGAEGDVYVSDTGGNRIDEYSSAGVFMREFAVRGSKEGKGEGELKEPGNIATDSSGDVWIADKGNNRIEEFGPTGTFIKTFGAEHDMSKPQGVAVDSEGNVWVANTGASQMQVWSASGSGYGSEKPSAHDTQTIYYTAGGNAQVASCGEHPEWASLPCQVQPAAQPEGSLPALAVTTYTYNMWDESETTKSTSGTTTRTTTATYDSAGRPKTAATSSTVGKALPTVTDKYSETLGALEEVSNEGQTKPIVSHYNTLGQLTSYSDATESTTTYEYDIDGRVKKVNDGKGAETYKYSATTGLPTELLNEYGTTKLTFTAKYDGEGHVLTEGYPNGMNANYTYNATGKPTSLEYLKTTHCTENCTWLSDSVIPSIHGQWLEQTSTLSHQAYIYDGAGRLTQVQNTPAGKGCTTRIYAYDEDTNRTGLTTREPGTEGKCATEGGTIEKHTYDQADRLNDAGVSYNAFGDINALPATDAGGKEASEGLTSEYYVDNQLASQTQGEQTIGYHLDPAGRTLETVATGKRAETVTGHYAGPGDTPVWTSNAAGETTREIPGIAGTLTATQSNLSEPVLQLTNLHGDIIATAYLSETATALASKADTSEYGVPTTSLPPKYSWLGALDIPNELPSGAIDLGARSYVPQLGRFLQPDPISGGSANAYSYTFGDPVNTSDPSGESTMPSSWSISTSEQYADETGAPWIAEQAAIKAAEEAIVRELGSVSFFV